MLIANPKGHFRFLKGIAPYSSGAVADAGYEVVQATFLDAPPWREGFERIDAHLKAVGRDRHALCGVALRCSKPYPMDGFVAFNRAYCTLLEEWGILVDGENPVARTNVAPVNDPPGDPVVYGFFYTVSTEGSGGETFVVAGAGELHSRELDSGGIIRRGETSAEAMKEKAAYVVSVMGKRLAGLGGTWEQVTAVDVYTAHPFEGQVEKVVLDGVGKATRLGGRRFYTRPPVEEIEFEMDLRGVRREIYL